MLLHTRADDLCSALCGAAQDMYSHMYLKLLKSMDMYLKLLKRLSLPRRTREQTSVLYCRCLDLEQQPPRSRAARRASSASARAVIILDNVALYCFVLQCVVSPSHCAAR